MPKKTVFWALSQQGSSSWLLLLSPGYYIYMEASDLLNGQEVRLESEEFLSPVCLHFHYHMYGEDTKELRLEQRNFKDNSTKVVWSMKGEQEDYWHSGLQDFHGDHYTVNLERTWYSVWGFWPFKWKQLNSRFAWHFFPFQCWTKNHNMIGVILLQVSFDLTQIFGGKTIVYNRAVEMSAIKHQPITPYSYLHSRIADATLLLQHKLFIVNCSNW